MCEMYSKMRSHSKSLLGERLPYDLLLLNSLLIEPSLKTCSVCVHACVCVCACV